MTVAQGHALILLLPVLVIAGFWICSVIDRRRLGSAAGPGFFERHGWPIGVYLFVAVAVWSIVMIVLPQLFMIDMSFRPKLPLQQVGGPKDVYTLENYRYFLFGSNTSTASWNVVHLRAFATTIVCSILIALVNFLLCYPLAFYMAQAAGPARLRLLLLLLVAPFWLNEILRSFAFRVIFAHSGLLNGLLIRLGLIAEPVDFLGMDVALYAGLTYAHMLLMVFPLYNAIESLEKAQIEAARDLGAPWWHIHLFIVIPFAKPGIASGCTLVFMLTTGSLAAPLVLGGPSSLWFTPIVYDRFHQVFNWPQGAAYAFVLLLACILFVITVLRMFRLNFSEVAR